MGDGGCACSSGRSQEASAGAPRGQASDNRHSHRAASSMHRVRKLSGRGLLAVPWRGHDSVSAAQEVTTNEDVGLLKLASDHQVAADDLKCKHQLQNCQDSVAPGTNRRHFPATEVLSLPPVFFSPGLSRRKAARPSGSRLWHVAPGVCAYRRCFARLSGKRANGNQSARTLSLVDGTSQASSPINV